MSPYRYDSTAIATSLEKIRRTCAEMTPIRKLDLSVCQRLSLFGLRLASTAFRLAFAGEIAPEH